MYIFKVFKLIDEIYQDVTSDLEYVESIDNVKCAVDFSSKAVGEVFKVAITPAGLTEKQIDKIDEYRVQFEFEVVDGYNVYNAKDLALYENRTEGEVAEAWIKFKQENNILKCNYYCKSH